MSHPHSMCQMVFTNLAKSKAMPGPEHNVFEASICLKWCDNLSQMDANSDIQQKIKSYTECECKCQSITLNHIDNRKWMPIQVGSVSGTQSHSDRMRSESKDYQTCSYQLQRGLGSLRRRLSVRHASIFIPRKVFDNSVTRMGSTHGQNIRPPMSTTCRTAKQPSSAVSGYVSIPDCVMCLYRMKLSSQCR